VSDSPGSPGLVDFAIGLVIFVLVVFVMVTGLSGVQFGL